MRRFLTPPIKVSVVLVVLMIAWEMFFRLAPGWAPAAAVVTGACDKWSEVEPVTLAEPTLLRQTYRDQYHFSGGDWFSTNVPVWEKALADYRGKPGVRYLEVGVFEGRSSIWMLDNILTHPSSRATVIDPFLAPANYPGTHLEEAFLANLRASGAEDRTTVIKGYSQLELRELPLDSYDIIYVDGSHTADDVLEDVVLAWRLLKNGGLIILDDYGWPADYAPEMKPKIAIDAFTRCYTGAHN